jgi:hypothetical protein
MIPPMAQQRIQELDQQVATLTAENAELRQLPGIDELELLTEVARSVTALTKRFEGLETLVDHLISASDDMRTQASAVRGIAERLFEVVDGLNEKVRKLPCQDDPEPCDATRDTERPPSLHAVSP